MSLFTGSFRCDCVEGYIKDNETCINIDECANGTDDCVDPLNGVSVGSVGKTLSVRSRPAFCICSQTFARGVDPLPFQ